MKLIKTIVVASAFCAASAFAVDPVKTDISCAQLGETYEATAEAKERFTDLAGSCEGVYDIDGHQFVRVQATVRSRRGNTVRLYLPATDHTFEVTAGDDGRVWIGGRKMPVRTLGRGDEIGIYLSVERFAQERVTEVAFATEDDHEEAIVVAPVEEVAALPTTG